MIDRKNLSRIDYRALGDAPRMAKAAAVHFRNFYAFLERDVIERLESIRQRERVSEEALTWVYKASFDITGRTLYQDAQAESLTGGEWAKRFDACADRLQTWLAELD